jgi:hypothetical protein
MNALWGFIPNLGLVATVPIQYFPSFCTGTGTVFLIFYARPVRILARTPVEDSSRALSGNTFSCLLSLTFAPCSCNFCDKNVNYCVEVDTRYRYLYWAPLGSKSHRSHILTLNTVCGKDKKNFLVKIVGVICRNCSSSTLILNCTGS